MVRMSLASFRFRSRTVFFGLAAAAVSAARPGTTAIKNNVAGTEAGRLGGHETMSETAASPKGNCC